MDSSESKQGRVAGSTKHDNELSGCKNVGKFSDRLSDYQLLKDSTP